MQSSPTRRNVLLGAASGVATSACADLGGAFAKAPDRLAGLEIATGRRIGVAGLNTGNGAIVSHRADERFPFCSTFKLVAVSAILARSSTDRELLDRRITYTEHDLVSYSPVTSQHAVAGMTVATLCAAALQYSDNTAANLIIRLLGGPDAVTTFARSMGDEMFRLDRWETALNEAAPGDPRDTTTPAAMMTDLRRATLGDLLHARERDQLVTWMQGCMTGLKRIRAAVPTGWLVADKTGSGDHGTMNDIAVIWPPGKAPLVLVVYSTRRTRDAPMRDDVVATAAKIALEVLS